jgi:hypothetical protein
MSRMLQAQICLDLGRLTCQGVAEQTLYKQLARHGAHCETVLRW